jgi:uncharacterized protein (TIGR01319 family)
MRVGLAPHLLCVDVGSTFTKAAVVDTATGALVASAQHRTTIDTDVLDGIEACRAVLATDAPALVCSSAGGGLRIAVVGNEELVTAEAGRRVALSSGGKVVAVLAGGLDAERYASLEAAAPDVILLVGGTDGGNAEQLLHDAGYLAARGWPRPVVVAGDAEAAGAVALTLEAGGVPFRLTDNVVPRIGVFAPDEARRAMRAVFLEHVIGGKELSEGPAFASMVLGATPDVVLLGVEVLAGAHGSTVPGAGVLVVDVGGATTDVHSVVVPDPEEQSLARDVIAASAVTRTVEGDLGMRWSAVSTADLVGDADLSAAARRLAEDPGFLATSAEERAIDRRLAEIAVRTAVRRHAGRSRVVLSPDGRVVERSGKNVRAVDLVVGSGGVLRGADADTVAAVLGGAIGVERDGWQVPESPRVVVDHRSVLAVAGLLVLHGERTGLVDEASAAARALLCTSVIGTSEGSTA